jgi:hypothetical protein
MIWPLRDLLQLTERKFPVFSRKIREITGEKSSPTTAPSASQSSELFSLPDPTAEWTRKTGVFRQIWGTNERHTEAHSLDF